MTSRATIVGSVVVPGQEFFSAQESQPMPSYQPGKGVFQRNGALYASIVGKAVREGGTISVISHSRSAAIPVVGTLVTGTITKVTKSQAHLSTITIEDMPLPIGQEFQGVIRSQDVRQVDKDRVVLANCFRPGDIVRAEVISLPTSSMGYLLATFRNNLGVVFAKHSGTGNTMTAINWLEMLDEETGQKEFRKVAGGS